MFIQLARTWHYQIALKHYEDLLDVNKNIIIPAAPANNFWEK